MTDKWIKDTGLVLVLFFLVLGLKGNRTFLLISIVLLIVSIIVPKTFYPLSYVWLKIAEGLNFVIPKIFFSIVFFVIIFPIGTLRHLIKHDIMFINSWRETKTIFGERNHRLVREDLEMPY